MNRFSSIKVSVSLGVVLFVSGCSNRTGEYVYVIEKTKTYHKKTCAPVKMAQTVVMTETDARRLHYHPCPACELHTKTE